MTTIEIPLSRGLVALIDEADAPAITGLRWHAVARRRTFYAVAETRPAAGVRKGIYMHRLVIASTTMVDHINGNGLDNRRVNLRAATNAENQWNRIKTTGASKYKGVRLHKASGLWNPRIRVNNRVHSLGYHRTEEAAALAYDDAARRLHGEFALVNFPRPGERSALVREQDGP